MPIHLCGGCPADVCNSGRPCETGSTTYAGAVLGKYERNGAHDSDFCATVWDATSGTVLDIEYASTRSWTYHNGAHVDATDDVRAAAMAWYRERWIESTVEHQTREALKPELRRTVRSLLTRGKNVGVVGVVEWFGVDKYRSTRYVTHYRVGIHVEGERDRRYLPADKVEVAFPEPVDVAEIRTRAATLPEPAWGGVLRSLVYAAIRTATV